MSALTRTAILFIAGTVGCGPESFQVISVGDGRDLRAVDIGPDGQGWMVGRQGALHRYRDGEVAVGTYSFEDTGGVRTPDLFAGRIHLGDLFLGGDDAVVVRASERDPEREDAGARQRWLTFVEVSPSVLLAAGEGGTVRQRSPDGWRTAGINLPSSIRVTGSWSAAGFIALTTDTGEIIERNPDGEWTRQPLTTETTTVPIPLFDVWSSTAGADLYVVGLGGAMFRRPADDDDDEDPNGAQGGPQVWQQIVTPAIEDLYALDGRSETDIFAAGAGGTIIQFDGSEWRRVSSSTGRDLWDVRATPSEVVAVGADGTVVRRAE